MSAGTARAILTLVGLTLALPLASGCGRGDVGDRQAELPERPLLNGGAWLLEAGSVVRPTLQKGETVVFELELPEGQLVRLVFDSTFVDLETTVTAPGGEVVARAVSVEDRWGPEEIHAVTEATGVYRIDVRHLPSAEPRGSFSLELAKVRPAGARDREAIEAERLYHRGLAALEERAWEKAQRLLEELLLRPLSGSARSRALYFHAVALVERGRFDEALQQLESSRDYWLDAGDDGWNAQVLFAKADCLAVAERYEESERASAEALAIWRRLGVRQHEAMTLLVRGWSFRRAGEYQLALDANTEALRLSRELGLRERVARSLINVGAAYRSLGQPARAIKRYEQAIPILRELGNRSEEATTLNNIGWSHKVQGQPQRAVQYFDRALGILAEIERNKTESESWVSRRRGTYSGNKGRAYLDLGRPSLALDACSEGLLHSIDANHGRGQSQRLLCQGLAHRDLGQYDRAERALSGALELSRSIGDKGTFADAAVALARLRRAEGELLEARRLTDSALAIIEAVRTDVDIQSMKAAYLAFHRSYYELQIDTLMDLYRERAAFGFAVEALQMSERARARSLLELLGEAAAAVRARVDPELLKQEREVWERVNKIAMQRVDGSESQQVLERMLDEQLFEIESRIRRENPAYAALALPQPLTLDEIRQEVLGPESLLLEYSLGAERSWLWAVSRDEFAVFELAPREVIEDKARQLYELLAAPAPTFSAQEEERQRRLRQSAAELSSLVLKPAKRMLGRKVLLVVAEGALSFVPFGVLPKPADADESEPLIVEHEVVSLPSASVVPALRGAAESRQPPTRLIRVFADPVFGRSDQRVHLAGGVGEEAAPELNGRSSSLRSLERGGWASFPRLRHSREEARAIAALLEAGEPSLLFGFEASREAALSTETAGYRILHFATHGILDSRYPRLSGLVLSLVDSSGRPRNGVLRLHDIYNMRLSADLVVLSACQSGIGKEVRGEGLIGLTRGFLHAGARSVVASLWNVEDRATAELMGRFYRGMLRDGLPAAAALRRAQLELRRGEAGDLWRSEYFWAPFVFYGERRADDGVPPSVAPGHLRLAHRQAGRPVSRISFGKERQDADHES